MNMFQNATISGGNITFNLIQQQWSMTINNFSSVRYYNVVWQLRSAILLQKVIVLDEWMNSDVFVQSNLCWKIHTKYVFHVNIHIFVLKYLFEKQIFQNQFKISKEVNGTATKRRVYTVHEKLKMTVFVLLESK